MVQRKSYMISNARRIIISVTVIIAAMMQLIDTSIVNVALPHIMGNLGADLDEATWIVTSYVFANVVILPMTGWLAARFGRKQYFMGSIVLFVMASVMCGQSTSIWELVVFRFIQGLAGGGLMPVSRVILIESYSPEDLGLANAIFAMGIITGPTIGPTLGGWLTDSFTWRWIFYVNVPIGIIALLMAMANVTNPADAKKAGRVDWLGILFLFIGFGSLQIVLERGERDNWFSSSFIVILSIIAVIGILLFLLYEFFHHSPVVDLRVFRHKNFAVSTFFSFMMGLGLFGSVFIFPIFTQNLLGYSALQTGLIMVPGALTAALLNPVIGILLRKKVSPQLLAFIGIILFFVFSVMISNETMQYGPGDFFWPLILRGLGLGFLSVPINTIALTGMFGQELSESSGILSMIRQLGGSFGVALITTLIDRRVVFHRTALAVHINQYNPQFQQWFASTVQHFVSTGSALSTARQQGYKALSYILMQQSSVLAYNDTYYVIGLFFLVISPLLLFTFTRKHKKAAVVPVKMHKMELVKTSDKTAMKT
ncbi:MAG TPA: DHA2 family efflux MFS transporter permease subunit [Balneolales bacterium]|nr:DHA2 family efflux MFS transporter permease subunit [Balneolales bacterium]